MLQYSIARVRGMAPAAAAAAPAVPRRSKYNYAAGAAGTAAARKMDNVLSVPSYISWSDPPIGIFLHPVDFILLCDLSPKGVSYLAST